MAENMAEEDLWERLEKYIAISLIVIAASTAGAAISLTFYAAKTNKNLNAIIGQLTSLNGEISALGKKVDALDNIGDTLKKMASAGDRTKLLDKIAPDLIEALKKTLGDGFEKVDEISLATKIREFLAARGVKATDTLVEELTKAALCKVLGISCEPSVTVNSAPIVIQQNGDDRQCPRCPINAVSTNSELRLYMSVWFPRTNTTDDQGATEKLIVPRIKRHIGARKDCKIFVSGNADTSGVDSYNRDLSEQRAAVVSKFLETIFGDIVDSKPIANGERSLLDWSADGSHNIYNRRTDILVACGQ
jgi:outer membrane protein OmpA-like peptidoglycan-associated protein